MRERLFTTPPLTIIGCWMQRITPCTWSNQSPPALTRWSGLTRPSTSRSPVAPVALLLTVLSSLGCQPLQTARPADPRQTLDQYRRALASDNAQAAYDLLSPDAQTSVPRELFSNIWGSTKEERAEQQTQLATLDNQRTPLDRPGARLIPLLRLSMSGGSLVPSELQLSAGPTGVWRVASPELAPLATTTPEGALRALLEALDGRNLALMLRLLSPATRQAVEDELQERADRLRAALAAGLSTPADSSRPTTVGPPRLEITGSRARLQYDQRFFIELVHEKDGWRVRDMN